MIGLIRAEFIKVAGRKLWWIMTGILTLLMAGTAFVFTVLPNVSPEELQGMEAIEKPEAYLFGAGQALGQTWFPLVFAAVLLASETSTSVWASSLTRESRRWMHLIARVVVASLASTLAMGIGIAAWSVVTVLFADGSGGPGITEWLSVAWKTGLTQVTWVGLAFGMVALFRNMAPAIGVALGFSFLDGILSLWEPWTEVSLSIASTRLVQDLSEAMGPFTTGVDMGFGQAMIVVFGWTGLGLLLALVGLEVRDP
jgi:hypothetical protein